LPAGCAYFLAHKLAGLRAWRLAFALGLLRSLNGFLLGHSNLRWSMCRPARISPADVSLRRRPGIRIAEPDVASPHCIRDFR
jgi:hypothetical protein